MKRILLPAAMFVAVVYGIFTVGLHQAPAALPPVSTPVIVRPRNLQIRSDWSTTNALRWFGVVGANAYEVQVKSRTNDRDSWQSMEWESLSVLGVVIYRHNNVTPGTTYLYRVRALDDHNSQIGDWSLTTERTIPSLP